MANQNPCFGCQSRHMACHAGCAKYASWKEQHEEMRKQRKQAEFMAKLGETCTMRSCMRVQKERRKRDRRR